MVIQKLKKVSGDNYQLAERYYGLLSSLNSLDLTNREIQLVAYAAIHGNVAYTLIKKDFCLKYNTSVQTIYNIVSKLVKLGVLVKLNGKIKVNPIIALDFNDVIKLEITLSYG